MFTVVGSSSMCKNLEKQLQQTHRDKWRGEDNVENPLGFPIILTAERAGLEPGALCSEQAPRDVLPPFQVQPGEGSSG